MVFLDEIPLDSSSIRIPKVETKTVTLLVEWKEVGRNPSAIKTRREVGPMEQERVNRIYTP